MRLVIILAALALAVTGAAVRASDTIELPAGGLLFVPDERIVVEAQEIVLARDAVKSTYALRNRSTEPLTRMLAWPLPEIDMNVLGEDVVVLAGSDPRNFAAVAVSLDGVAVPIAFEQRAWAFARDVTALLEAGGVALNPKAGGVEEQLAALPPERVGELEERGVVHREDDRLLPGWAVKTTAYWRQTFEPDKLLTLGVAYVPVTGSGLWAPDKLADMKQAYCIDSALEAEIARRAASTGRGLVLHRLTYSMANSPGWFAPIANFRLVIEKTGVETLVATCEAGLKPIGPTLLEGVTRDFRPKEDIRVLFIN